MFNTKQLILYYCQPFQKLINACMYFILLFIMLKFFYLYINIHSEFDKSLSSKTVLNLDCF
jgi:hypothetical protein